MGTEKERIRKRCGHSRVWERAKTTTHRVQRMSWGHDIKTVMREETYAQDIDTTKNSSNKQKASASKKNNSFKRRSLRKLEIAKGEGVYFASRIALKSHRGNYLMVKYEKRGLRLTTCDSFEEATQFTIVDLNNSQSRGPVFYGHDIWFQVNGNYFLGSKVCVQDTKDLNNQRKSIVAADLPGKQTSQKTYRLNRPHVIKGNQNKALTLAKWKLTDPRNVYDTWEQKKGEMLGNLDFVALEQNWQFLTDDELHGKTIKQSNLVPSSLILSSDQDRGHSDSKPKRRTRRNSKERISCIEATSLWQIILCYKPPLLKADYSEHITELAQKQLGEFSEKRKNGLGNFATTISVGMQEISEKTDFKYLSLKDEDRKNQDIDAFLSSSFQRMAQRTRYSSGAENIKIGKILRAQNAKELEYVQNEIIVAEKQREKRIFEKQDKKNRKAKEEMEAKKKNEKPLGFHTMEFLKSETCTKNVALLQSKATVLATVDESRVTPEVWREIFKEENRMKHKEIENQIISALSIQKAFRKWQKGKWSRLFSRTDEEYKQKCIAEYKESLEAEERKAQIQRLAGSDSKAQIQKFASRKFKAKGLGGPTSDRSLDDAGKKSGVNDSLSVDTSFSLSSDVSSHYKLLKIYNPDLFDNVPNFISNNNHEEREDYIETKEDYIDSKENPKFEKTTEDINYGRYDYRKVRPKSANSPVVRRCQSVGLLSNNSKNCRPQTSGRTRIKPNMNEYSMVKCKDFSKSPVITKKRQKKVYKSKAMGTNAHDSIHTKYYIPRLKKDSSKRNLMERNFQVSGKTCNRFDKQQMSMSSSSPCLKLFKLKPEVESNKRVITADIYLEP